MSDDGTFPCPIKWTQQETLSNFVGTLDARGVDVPQEVRNLAGRINYYAAQAKPSDPLREFTRRLGVGQLCAWALVTDAERTALDALYNPGTVVQYVQFYGASGGGGMNVNVRAAGAGFEFFSLKADAWLPDVGGAGDAYVAWLCARNDPPRAVPAPFPK
jgi:hypothetical protein